MNGGEECVWRYDGVDAVWWSGCGEGFYFDTGTPSENGFKFCPYCGRPLVERYEEEGEEI